MDKKLFQLFLVFIVGFVLVVGDHWAKLQSEKFGDNKVVQIEGPSLAALAPMPSGRKANEDAHGDR